MSELKAVVLAGGKGTRMRTEGCDLPKVMRLALGRPLLSYVLDALPVERQDAVVVVGYMRETVMDAFPECQFAVQEEQLGTGHAVMCAMPALAGFTGSVLVCCGDAPLISKKTYAALWQEHQASGNDCTLLSGTAPEVMPGYGRMKRDEKGNFLRIVEAKDCTPEEYNIKEYNSGVMIFKVDKLAEALKELRTDNAQGEYYITDAPDIMMSRGDKVGVCVQPMGDELIGVNTPEQLLEVEAALMARK